MPNGDAIPAKADASDEQLAELLTEVRGRTGELGSDLIDSMANLSRDHVQEVRRTGTTDSVDVEGRPLIVLSTIGAKSGNAREHALIRVEQDGAYVLVGSMAGAPRNPDWYYNALANPNVRIMDGVTEREYIATEASGEQRDKWWAIAVETFPDYSRYQTMCDREIPVLIAQLKA